MLIDCVRVCVCAGTASGWAGGGGGAGGGVCLFAAIKSISLAISVPVLVAHLLFCWTRFVGLDWFFYISTMAASSDSENVNGSSNSDSTSPPPPPSTPPEKVKDVDKEDIGNGISETHPKAVKREAENGVKTENGEPAAKIKRESKYMCENVSIPCFFSAASIHSVFMRST